MSLPSPARAQAPAPVSGVRSTLQTVDSLFGAQLLRESLDAAVALADEHPGLADAHWRATRAAIVIGMTKPDRMAQNPWYDQGIEHGEQAVALDPGNLDALYWLAAAKGRRALWATAGHAAGLAQEVWTLAHRILEADPDHAGAHNALGKLHFEVMVLPRLQRAMGRLVMGHSSLREANWDDAVRHHERAVALDPDMILYRVELGETYLRRGRTADARAALEAALALPARYVPDPLLHERARSLLAELADSR